MTNYWSSIVLMAVLGLAMFGRDWMNQDTRIPDTWRTDALRWSVLFGVTALAAWLAFA